MVSWESLDGVRGTSCLLIVLHHFLSYIIQNVTHQQGLLLFQYTLGDSCGVEFLFFISGFLLTCQLVDTCKRPNDPHEDFSANFSLSDFYMRRFAYRVYPSLFLLPLFLFLIPPYSASHLNPYFFATFKETLTDMTKETIVWAPFSALSTLPHIFLGVSNYLPLGGFLVWLWSLSVQMQ